MRQVRTVETESFPRRELMAADQADSSTVISGVERLQGNREHTAAASIHSKSLFPEASSSLRDITSIRGSCPYWKIYTFFSGGGVILDMKLQKEKIMNTIYF